MAHDEQQAMTASERIVRQWREGPLEVMPSNILLETAQRLQADNERLRAELASAEAREAQWALLWGKLAALMSGDVPPRQR